MARISILLLVLFAINSQSSAQVTKFNFKQQLNQNPTEIIPFSVPNTKSNLSFLLNSKAKVKHVTKEFIFISTTASWLNTNVKNGNISDFFFEYAPPVALDDTARAMHFVNEVHNGEAPLTQGYTGKGVIIGYVDQGLDFEHPDFKDENGVSRVLRYWDHTASSSATSPAPYGYGQVCDSTEIANGTCPYTETGTAHGTTVTGIGSGNGLSNNSNSGMAPESSIIVVESNFNMANWTLTIADACDYIFKVADSLNMPAIVNLSLGSYLGSHDGDDPAAVLIESLLDEKPGRLVISAAGNSGAWGNYHVHDEVTSDTSFVWLLNNTNGQFGPNTIYFDLWAENSEASFDFGYGADDLSYSFRGISNFTTANVGITPVVYDTIYNANQERIATIETYREIVGDNFHLQCIFTNVDSTDYQYRFMTTGSGSYDLWSTPILGLNQLVENIPDVSVMPNIIHYNQPDSLQTIVSSWNCSEKVVSVGNVRNRLGHIDNNGNQYYPATDLTSPGKLAPSSSKGPARTGLTKPDISASGDVTLAAGPLWAVTNPAYNALIDSGGFHLRNGGTSMASPTVAGIAALYLEKCETGSYTDFLEIIKATAIVDDFTGVVPNIGYGYGKINAFNMMTTNIPTITDESGVYTASPQINYQWFFNGDEIAGEIEQTLTPTSGAGIYRVGVTGENGCVEFSNSIEAFVGITENDLAFDVYPNPTKGIVNIVGEEIIVNSIVNSLGKEVAFNLMQHQDFCKIDLSELSKGVYFVKIETQNKYTTIKIIKE